MGSPPRYEGTLETPLLQRVRDAIRADVDPDFAFLAPGPAPFAPLARPLGETTVALVTTAGLHRRGDPPFRVTEDPLGDPTFRVIPQDLLVDELDLTAVTVEQRHTPHDPEVALPRRALAALANEGLVGAPAPRHASFCGGLVRAYPGLAESAERLASQLREDGAGAAVLLPTCSLCVQTMGLVARELEERGVATVCLTLLPELTRIVQPPRALAVHFPFGAPCGDPGNAELHRAVLREALGMLAEVREPGTLRESVLQWRREPDRSGVNPGSAGSRTPAPRSAGPRGPRSR